MARDDYEEYRRKQEADEQARSVAGALVSSDGRIFGIKVPEPFPSLWSLLGTDAMRVSSKYVAQGVGTAVAKATHSEAAGAKAKESLQYLVPFIPQGIQATVIRKNHNKNRDSVLEPLSSLLSANKAANNKGVLHSITAHFDNGYGDNHMINTALHKVTEETYKNMKGLALTGVQPVLNGASAYLENMENPTDKHVKAYNFINDWGGKIGGAIELSIKKSSKNAELSEELANSSYGKVIALKEMIRVNNLDNPSSVASGSAVAAVASSVEDIFQTYQKEMKYRPIPSHRMREVSKIIAEELVSGDLNVLSLVNIVGNDKLLTEKKETIVSSDKIAEVIKQETAIFSKNSAMTSEDFMRTHENITLDDIKSHLHSPNMDERALVAILVPESVLLEAGAKKEDIKNYQQHISGKLQESIFTSVVSGLAAQSDEQLESKGMSREAIVFVREHEGPGAESIAHVMQSKAGQQQLKDIAIDALVGQESTVWRDTIAAGKAAAIAHSGKKEVSAKDTAWADQKVKNLVAEAAAKGPRSPMDYAEQDQSVVTR